MSGSRSRRSVNNDDNSEGDKEWHCMITVRASDKAWECATTARATKNVGVAYPGHLQQPGTPLQQSYVAIRGRWSTQPRLGRVSFRIVLEFSPCCMGRTFCGILVWIESVKPLQYYCSCLPVSILLPTKKLLFWKKMSCSGNVILCRLAKCCDASIFAPVSYTHLTLRRRG